MHSALLRINICNIHYKQIAQFVDQKDFDSAVLGTIIDSFASGAPLQQAEIDKAKEKVKNTDVSGAAAEVAAPVPAQQR